MIQELSDESRRMDLKMNIAKTKVMVVDNTPINVNNGLIEKVQGYVYLGQHYSINIMEARGRVVSALDCEAEGRWFESHSGQWLGNSLCSPSS